MTTLNTDAQVPDVFFIFVSMVNPIARNQFEHSGIFYSTSYMSAINPNLTLLNAYNDGKLEFIPSEDAENLVEQVSPFFFGIAATPNYPLEVALEQYRREHYGFYPSRLAAIYAFGDMGTCEKVVNIHQWNESEIQRFETFNLSDIPNSPGIPSQRITKHNMEIISFLRGNGDADYPHLNDAMEMYWSGRGEVDLPDLEGNMQHIDAIYEYLIDGMVRRINHH